jgi:hypothetical protein
MKDLGNPKFEDNWRNVFSDAEATPSESVWTNIDLQLSRADNSQMRKRVVSYQRLVAASIFLALLMGGAIWYSTNNSEHDLNSTSQELTTRGNSQDTDGSNLAGDNPNEKTGSPTQDNKDSRVANNNSNRNSNLAPTKSSGSVNSNIISVPSDDLTNTELVAIQSDQGSATGSKMNKEEFFANAMTADYSTNTRRPETVVKVAGKINTEIPGISELSRRFTHVDDSKTEKRDPDNWVASIGGASGGYSSQASNSNPGLISSKAFQGLDSAPLNDAPSSERESFGNTYSIGLTMGKKISPRWLITSGFNYMNQSIDYKSNIAVVDAGNQSKAFIADLALESSAITTTQSYTLNSVNEFISVPIQVGYIIVNRKIGFQLNTGVAADFFVKNKLADETGLLASYSDGGGKNSSYRTLNWAGLLGTELSYKVAKHYKVSLVPGLRYSFTSVLRPSTGTTLRPFAWDLGFRFGYIF